MYTYTSECSSVGSRRRLARAQAHHTRVSAIKRVGWPPRQISRYGEKKQVQSRFLIFQTQCRTRSIDRVSELSH
eukprot:6189622-Pleurochrysis_carterae.AAC.2